MREPALAPEALARWVAGPGTRPKTPDDPNREGLHAYLFARVGGPSGLAPRVVTRAVLVGACSGVVLAVGLVLMSVPGMGRAAWIGLPAALLAASLAASPGVMLLVGQSSALGFALLAVAGLTRRLVERRGPIRPGFVEPSGLRPGIGSGFAGVPGPGPLDEDGSTVVRSRSGTTADHAPAVGADGAREG